MSHFSVLVVTDERPTDEKMRELLMPWHEFECTGEDNEYVQEIDQTQEAREKYAADTSTRLRAPDGVLWSPYEVQFYREPTEAELAKHGGRLMGTGWSDGISYTSRDWGDGKGYRGKVRYVVRYVPDGYEEVTVPTKDIQSFRDFVEGYYGKKAVLYGELPDLKDTDKHKYGYALLDQSGDVVKVVDRTNPDRKWDWFQIGGRYSARLVPKAGRDSARKGKRSWTNEDQELSGYDICQVCDLDLEAMQAARSKERQEWIDDIIAKSGCSRGEVDAAIALKPALHARWLELPEPRPRGGEYYDWAEKQGDAEATVAKISRAIWDWPEVPAGQSVQDWIAAAPPLTVWAVIKDGKWYEKGSMGWWGMSSGDKDDWDDQLVGLFASLRPDQFVSIVDCHI